MSLTTSWAWFYIIYSMFGKKDKHSNQGGVISKEYFPLMLTLSYKNVNICLMMGQGVHTKSDAKKHIDSANRKFTCETKSVVVEI